MPHLLVVVRSDGALEGSTKSPSMWPPTIQGSRGLEWNGTSTYTQEHQERESCGDALGYASAGSHPRLALPPVPRAPPPSGYCSTSTLFPSRLPCQRGGFLDGSMHATLFLNGPISPVMLRPTISPPAF